ncbi:unnamed protein product [Clonostachys rosea f. rosea IK726]|uniref:Uncharacterized protein n=1 Tax=Clonostachys rosea f. rosea IK726 TaxID=1349383 RepID=A0ACA9TM64_BIOOC|nr:unnamed protein product [Clonostachys rosea f. rosea IK726]
MRHTARKFVELIDYFDQGNNQKPRDKRYNRIKLVRLMYEYTYTEESKGNFLCVFFESAGTLLDDNFNSHLIDLSNPNTEAVIRDSIYNFADDLFKNFFLLLLYLAVLSILQEPYTFLSTPDRIAALRGACLIRDHHRCIITRLFDSKEAEKRINSIKLQGIVWFGNFKVFFEPVEQQAYTYCIDIFSPMILGDVLPVMRTLYLTESRTIDPPSPCLLAIHNAIAHILHLSVAGVYIDKILRDLEDQSVREDGLSELDLLVKLKLQLQGWLAG